MPVGEPSGMARLVPLGRSTYLPREGDRDGDAVREADAKRDRECETDVVTLKPRVGDRDGDAARDGDTLAETRLDALREADDETLGAGASVGQMARMAEVAEESEK